MLGDIAFLWNITQQIPRAERETALNARGRKDYFELGGIRTRDQ